MNPLRRIARRLTLRTRTEERYILERKIFPLIKNKTILWVGCAPYTAHYIPLLEKQGNNVYTIDTDPTVKQYGSKNHITDSISNATKHYSREFFDIVFMTGVFGYGLNTTKEAEQTMKAVHKILKSKGILTLWWADREGRNMIAPKNLQSYSLYKPFSFKQYPNGYRTKKGVVLEFLKKN